VSRGLGDVSKRQYIYIYIYIPGGKRTVTCGGQKQFYCASWVCETSVMENEG
jgi:hypothetical protein